MGYMNVAPFGNSEERRHGRVEHHSALPPGPHDAPLVERALPVQVGDGDCLYGPAVEVRQHPAGDLPVPIAFVPRRELERLFSELLAGFAIDALYDVAGRKPGLED